MKDIIEHFPVSKGPKSDPQLVWSFEADEVLVKSLENVLESKGISEVSYFQHADAQLGPCSQESVINRARY